MQNHNNNYCIKPFPKPTYSPEAAENFHAHNNRSCGGNSQNPPPSSTLKTLISTMIRLIFNDPMSHKRKSVIRITQITITDQNTTIVQTTNKPVY